MTPAALLIGRYLCHCPLSSPYDAAMALSLTALAMHIAAAAKRYVPEAVALLTKLLTSAAVAPLAEAAAQHHTEYTQVSILGSIPYTHIITLT